MRGTKPGIQWKREAMAALNLPAPVITDVSQTLGVVTVTFTAEATADSSDLSYQVVGETGYVVEEGVTSPHEVEVALESGQTMLVKMNSVRDGVACDSGPVSSVTYAAASQVGSDPCENMPAQSASKSDLLDWLASAGITIDDPTNFTKSELWSLVTDACD